MRRAAGGAGATVDATHRLRGLGEWRVRSHLRLVRQEGRRLVDWAPSGLHPDAEPGDAFERERSRPPRGEILGAGGQPLTVVGKVVSVGVQPARMTDQAAVATALQQHLGVDPARLDAALKAPHVEPDHFSVTAAGRLDDAALVAAAGRFGFGVAYSVGLGARSPADFPAPRDTAERAAAAIGQGRVLATPAHMASVAAAAVTGTWRGPVPARAGGGGGRDAAPVGARFAAAL